MRTRARDVADVPVLLMAQGSTEGGATVPLSPVELMDGWAVEHTDAAVALKDLARLMVFGVKGKKGSAVLGYRELGKLICELEV